MPVYRRKRKETVYAEKDDSSIADSGNASDSFFDRLEKEKGRVQKTKRKLSKKKDIKKKTSSNAIPSEDLDDSFEIPDGEFLQLKKKYSPMRCTYIRDYDENGEPIKCNSWATGSGTLCKDHGGVKENTSVSVSTEQALSAGSKFRPEVHPLMYIEFSRQGMSDVEIAAEFNIGLQTLKKWADKYRAFNVAYEIGQSMHEAWYLKKGKDNLENRNFNTNLYKFLTGNKLGYSDKIETKNLNINTHGVLVVPGDKTVEEWEAKIAAREAKEAAENGEIQDAEVI